MSTNAQRSFERGFEAGRETAALELDKRLMQAGVELLATALFLIEPAKEEDGSAARQGWIGLVLDLQKHLLSINPELAEQFRKRLVAQ